MEPVRSGPRLDAPARPSLYARRPSGVQRVAAVVMALLLLALAAWWLDWQQALIIWLLFSLFVVLWPNFPPATAAEERAQAWPFEP